MLDLRRRRELDLELRWRRGGFCLCRRRLERRLGLGGWTQGVLPPAEGGRGQLVLDDVQAGHGCLGGAGAGERFRWGPGEGLRLGGRARVGSGGGSGERLGLGRRPGGVGGLHLGEVGGWELRALP